MVVTYHFKDLSSLADYFDAKATEARDRATRGTRLRSKLDASAEAAALESVAHMLRNTVLKGD